MRNRSFLFSGLALSTAAVAVMMAISVGNAPVNAQTDATQAATVAATAAPAVSAASDSGVNSISGTVTVTNVNELNYFKEPVMLLIDLTAFIKRDREMKLPFPTGAVAAGLDGDLSTGAKFEMQLPIQPKGALNDLSNGKGTGKGVMTFAVDFDFNDGSVAPVNNGPVLPTLWKAWPGGLDSLGFDSDTNELATGMLLVWAPDNNEMFPTGFGADGKLFTADDPVGPIPQGWTLVNVDKKPFEQIRTAHAEVPIIEGPNGQVDYSKLSYVDAFDKLIADLKMRYVFAELKHINWDAIVTKIRPEVEAAKDTDAFTKAMSDLAAQFPDGHVYIDQRPASFATDTAAGIGMVLGKTDDGKVIARAVLDKLPAALAGIKPGAQIISWNGKPIDQALSETSLVYSNQSSPLLRLLQQMRYIMRGPVGTSYKIAFQNPGDSKLQTLDVTSVKERASFSQSSVFAGYDSSGYPISFKVLPDGTGYIKITVFETDTLLFNHMWDYAINQLIALQVPALIVDVRQNPGGFPGLADYAAGSFITKSFTLNQTYRANKKGDIVKVGTESVDPNQTQWTGPVAILIGPACASACEIFASAVSHDPAHLVVGSYSTSGTEGGIEPWFLPDGITFEAPVERFQNPDGSIFLEQVGLPPTIKVPITIDSLLSKDDQELPVAQKALKVLVDAAAATPAATAAVPAPATMAPTAAK